jgi:sialidase-1
MPARTWIILLSLLFAHQAAAETGIRFAVIEKATPDMPRADTASVCEISPGKLMVVYHKYQPSKLAGNDFGVCNIWSKTSQDGGLTWGDGRMIVDNAPGDVNVQAPALLKLSTGDVLLICHRNHSRSSGTMCLFRSRDGGRTFAEEPPIWKQSKGQWLQGGASSLLELKSGRVLLPLHGGTGDQGKQKNDIWCFMSDDHGKSWHPSRGRIALLKRGAMEASVAQLEDGSLAMSIRTQLGGPYFSRSTDDGETWEEARPTGLESGESCTCLRRIPGTNKLVLFWNNSKFIPKGHHHFGERTPLTAAVSADAGKTWRVVGNIVADPKNGYTNLGCMFTGRQKAIVTYMSNTAWDHGNAGLEAAIIDQSWFEKP